MGFALQGFIPRTKPPTIHHRRNTLLSLLPPVALPKILGPGSFGRMIRYLGWLGIMPIIDFRVFVLVQVGRAFGSHQICPYCLDLPLLGFHLLMVLTLISVQCLRSATATLGKLLVRCQIKNLLRFAA
jgi:hypothetical protein